MRIKQINIIIFFLILTKLGFCQDQLGIEEHSVYLIGNFADLDETDKLLDRFNQLMSTHSNNVSLLLLGDAVDYDSESRLDVEKLSNLKALIKGISTIERANLIMIPGDREWDNGGPMGFEKVLDLENTLKSFCKEEKITNFKWPASNGCPGPFSVELASHLQLVVINTQWWAHDYDKPLISDAVCKYISLRDLQAELNDAVEDQSNKNILIAGHHPFKSLSSFGGRFGFWQNFSPFPIYGTFKNSYQSNIGSPSYLAHQNFDLFKYIMKNLLYTHHSLIYATGHDKNQQIIKLGENYSINSGAVQSLEKVHSDFNTLYASSQPGIIELKYSPIGSVISLFHNLEELNQSNEQLNKVLFTTSCRQQDEEVESTNFLYIPCQLDDDFGHENHVHLNDLSSTQASDKYGRGKFGRFWMGDRYRDDWAADIDVPFLNIDTSYQGLKAYKKGGGKQTVSLKFISGDGDYYSFRSLDKLAKKSLDYQLQQSIISELFQRQVSAQHPYGALTIPPLLKKINILHSKPILYRIPDSKALGPFQHEYGGLLGMLELNPKKNKKTKRYFANADDIVQTNKLLRKIFENPNHQVDRHEYLKARLFDILIGDWDRHEDNWKWAAFKEGSKVRYRPIPKDRDNAYTKWDGVLPSLADEDFALFHLEGFDKKIRGFRSLVYQARNLDRLLLNSLSESDFREQAELIQTEISESDIRQAIAELPPTSFELSGQEIIEKLILRKNDLQTYAEKFYHLLNKEIVINGSNLDDKVVVKEGDHKHLVVTIRTASESNSDSNIIYERKINPADTELIRIYGLGGNDNFDISTSSQTKTEIVLVGGKGDNDYKISKKAHKVKILDKDFDTKDKQLHAHKVNPWNDKLYDFDRNEVKFNTYLPFASIGYEQFLGATLTGQISWTKRSWDKVRFSSKHRLWTKFSSKGDLGVIYNGQWGELLNTKWDGFIDLTLVNPDLINEFFGIGNTTSINEELREQDFFFARQNRYLFLFGLKRSFWKKSEISFGTGFGLYNSSPLDGSILSEAIDVTGSSGTLSTIPLLIDFTLDLRDNISYPTRGVQLKFLSHNYYQVASENNRFGLLGSSLDYHLSSRSKKKIILSLKAAGNLGYGLIPYYLQNRLGQNSGLRGFTGFRFTGSSMVYLNSELKVELIKNTSSAIPITLGVLGFYDRGRVFTPNESELNNNYHFGYGGGIYLIPFSRKFIFSLSFSWSEEQAFFPGFRFGSVF